MANCICPNCNESYHTTTDAYRPGEVTTGNMLTLKKQYVDNGWTSFPEHEGMKFADLYCPGCGGALSSDGRVRIDEAQYAAEQAMKDAVCFGQSFQYVGLGGDGAIKVSVISPKEVYSDDEQERKTFPGNKYAMAEPKEEKRKPGRPKRV